MKVAKTSSRKLSLGAMAVVVGLLASACDGGDEPADGAPVEQNADEARAPDQDTQKDVFLEPGDHVGDPVAVEGLVADVLGDSTLRIESTDVVGEELFVLHPKVTDLGVGDRVVAHGVVMDLDIPKIEREFDTEIDDDAVAEFDDDYAIVATEIDVLEAH